MTKATLYSAAGAKKETGITLNKEVFEIEPNDNLLALAYRSYLAGSRQPNAQTKTRGEVRGGGRKPWKQKGTGRARAGSIRIPQFRGGGVVFGPTGLENYQINLTIKSKRLAIRQALSAQAAEGRVAVLETFTSPDGKVQQTKKLLDKLKATGNTLIVVSKKDDMIDRATRNLPGVLAVQANYVNVFDVLNADLVLISKKSLDVLDSWLGSAKTPEPAKAGAAK